MKDLKEKVNDFFTVPEQTEEEKMEYADYKINKKVEELEQKVIKKGDELSDKFGVFLDKLGEKHPILAGSLGFIVGAGLLYLAWLVVKFGFKISVGLF